MCGFCVRQNFILNFGRCRPISPSSLSSSSSSSYFSFDVQKERFIPAHSLGFRRLRLPGLPLYLNSPLQPINGWNESGKMGDLHGLMFGPPFASGFGLRVFMLACLKKGVAFRISLFPRSAGYAFQKLEFLQVPPAGHGM